MRILIVSPAPPTDLKPRLYRFALGLASRAEVYLAFVDDFMFFKVSPTIRNSALNTLKGAGVKLYPLRCPISVPPRAAWNLMVRGLSLRESLFRQKGLKDQLRAVHRQVQPDIIHVDRARTACLLDAINTPVVIDLTDPIGWYLSQRAEKAKGLSRAFLAEEAKRMWRLEGALAKKSRILFASGLGASAFRAYCPQARISVVPNLLPPAHNSTVNPMSFQGSNPRLGFWGNLNYPPNVEAAVTFCNKIWPVIRQKMPIATLHIAGSSPHRDIARLASLKAVYIHSNPARMSDFIVACDIAISPVATCAGYPNKIVEAVVQGGLPIIATKAACAGLPDAVANKIVTASSAGEWLQRIEDIWMQKDRGRADARRVRESFVRHLESNTVITELLGIYQEESCNQRSIFTESGGGI